MEALLQRGASVCVRDIRGRSPLHLASACGRVGALGALLQTTNTYTHLTDNQGYTPLHWACYNGTETLNMTHQSVLYKCHYKAAFTSASLFQATMHVWRCYLTRRYSRRLKETLSVLCTVLCKKMFVATTIFHKTEAGSGVCV